jgi:hypothetical protein
MSQPRFNHIALSVPPGSLEQNRASIEKFYGGVLGAQVFNYEGVGSYLIISFDEDFPSQALVINEEEDFLQAPGFDHIGLEFETYDEVDKIIAACKEFKKSDDRLEIEQFPDGKEDGYEFRACYIKYLLPLKLDIQALRWESGREPKRWRYGP